MNDTQTDVQEGRLIEVGGEGFGREGELEESPICISEKTKARFWRKVNKTDGCWLWMASKYPNGYGMFSLNGHIMGAHRASWKIHFGQIPRGSGFHGTCVLHKCDVKLCVRPDHLFLGSNLENIVDMDSKGRRNTPIGEVHGLAKLTEQGVIDARIRYSKGGISQQSIADEMGVSVPTINHMIRRITWRHV